MLMYSSYTALPRLFLPCMTLAREIVNSSKKEPPMRRKPVGVLFICGLQGYARYESYALMNCPNRRGA